VDASLNRFGTRALLISGLAIAAVAAAVLLVVNQRPRAITVDYPLAGSVFPPEFPPPTFIWRDPSTRAKIWTVDVTFSDGAETLRATSHGEPMRIGEIDQRAVGPTNELPKLTPEQAAAHTWIPDAGAWEAIKKHSAERVATLRFTGYRDASLKSAVSHGEVAIQTSKDPVGAPVFYRDVPLMPSETEKGVIKPLGQKFMPLLAWRVRNIGETTSRVVMEGLHSCANCHSVSRDGKTMGMDVDGPKNNKGMYAVFPIKAETAIRRENVIEWSTWRGKLGGKIRVGFMSQVSPDGKYVVTMINDPGMGQTDYQRRVDPTDLVTNFYVANFLSFRFLQVFYPTHGILAWYSQETGKLEPLPGADDMRYVHTGATWSPDGKYLVFSRAEAKDAYPEGAKLAERANDPNETPIQYDLYRIPFNGGKGGQPEPIAGASRNGMSNSFPKISPDGRWIVFVEARNGQLMRPDSQLHIVPAEGGQARRMRCNTPLMNSWHSFSPNGRWMVFSSKSRSPYTQMYLTHIDEDGNDTPAILIENATAANRAVNIPEFVNIPADGLMKIDPEAMGYYRLIDLASAALDKNQYDEAITALKQALAENPGDAVVHNSYGAALAAKGRLGEATAQYRRAVDLSPDYPDAHNNLAAALANAGKLDEAIVEFRKALEVKPDYAEAHTGLGGILARRGRLEEAIPHLRKAVEYKPDDVLARSNLGLALSSAGKVEEAIVHEEQAVRLSGGRDPLMLDLLSDLYARAGRIPEASGAARQAMAIAIQAGDAQLAAELKAKIAAYEFRP
jgi:tetratricopeptide (TPR) repeat protein